jgi:nucleotide-binding universal stress UspA family protein
MKRVALPRPRGRRQILAAPARGALAGLGINRILVPLDLSAEARDTLHYAVALATDLRARIILLHVIEPIYVSASPGLSNLPQPIESETTAGARKLREIAAELIPPGLCEKAIVRTGHPAHEIAEAAKRLKAGLIVISTHGRTGLSHVLMGSTAERVVRHAPCPVLTVRRT